MATRRVRFYLDENLSPEIVRQLRRQGIDIIRGPLSAKDEEHLRRATDLRRVICTEDDDFLKLAAQGVEHPGIIKGLQDKHAIGDWSRFLRFIYAACTADEMRNEVLFLFFVD